MLSLLIIHSKIPKWDRSNGCYIRAPFYRVVVADSRYPRDGRFIEEIGTYNPMKDPAEIKIDVEKAEQWLKNGAQPTDTVKVILKKSGAIK